jgi:hypothetical protein
VAIFWGFIGGVIAWFATNFIGQPIVAFIAARSEAARTMAQFQYLDDDPERAERERNSRMALLRIDGNQWRQQALNS